MSIEYALRTQVSRAFGEISWEQNPLVTIGLSQAILSLRVTDQQLYKIVRGYLRQLAASVHPDAATGAESPDTIEERQKIMAAFELLDDEKIFLRALEEFKHLSSMDRSELAATRHSLRVTKSLLENASAELAQLEEKRMQLQQERSAFETRKAAEIEKFSRLTQGLNNTVEEKHRWRALFEKKQRANRQLLSASQWHQLYLLSQAPNWFNTQEALEEVVLLPVEAKRVVVLRFYFTEPKKNVVNVPLKKISSAAQARYHEAVEELRAIGKCNIPDVRPVFLVQEAKLHNGLINHAERIIGSFPINTFARTAYRRIERLPTRFSLQKILPFLIPGDVMVGILAPRFRPKFSSQRETYRTMERLIYYRNDYMGRVTTGRVLLDIE